MKSMTIEARDRMARTFRRLTRRCARCDRGQNPHIYTDIRGTFWDCRYCGQQHTTRARAGDRAPGFTEKRGFTVTRIETV